MFTKFGIDKSDIDIFVSIILTASNLYWMMKFNNVKFNDQLLKSLQDENALQEKEIKHLEKKIHQATQIKLRKLNYQSSLENKEAVA